MSPDGSSAPGDSRTIAYLGLAVTNPYFTDVARGVEDVARSHGLAVFLCNSDGDPSREDYYLDMLVEQRVRGVLVSPFDPLTAQSRTPPPAEAIAVILVGSDAGPEWCSAAVDDVDGGELAVTGTCSSGSSADRLRRWRDVRRCVADRFVGARNAMAHDRPAIPTR